MRKNIYVKPETEIVATMTERLMQEGSYALDGGGSTPIEEGDPDEVLSKHRDLWDGWDE